jgi:hypothetical protein
MGDSAMTKLPIDDEARASRFLSAMEGLTNLVSTQIPGLPMESEQLHGLLDILKDEAHAVLPAQPRTRISAND